MELVDEDIRRALLYVSMASGYGVGPTRDELEAFANRPNRIESRQGGSLATLTGLRALMATVSQITGTVTLESHCDFLLRVGWIRDQDGRLTTTPLGSSVRRALDAEAMPAGEVLHAVIEPDDDYAYARVLSRIADISDALVVDPYLKLEGLIDLRGLSNVRRILTSDEKQANLAKIGAFRAVTPKEGLEVRYLAARQMHDRYVIPSNGRALQLSTSLNSVGARIGVVVALDAFVSDAVREHHERLWREAERIERDNPQAEDGEDGEDGKEGSREAG